jgi:uncharacterized protein
MTPPPSLPTPALPGAAPLPDAAPVHEEVLALACGSRTLWGVVTLPSAQAQPLTGVVIVVGGPQYRVGSHRQFVQLARRLARAGHAVLRFDVRGMGDSAGLTLPDFTALDDDITEAINGLQQRLPSVQAITLWGLCDGASAALMYVQQHPQAPVAALCLANPWVRTAATQAQATVKHYYKDRLRQRAFWVKLLKGGVAVQALRDLLANLRQARGAGSAAATPRKGPLPFQTRMAQGWKQYGGPILLLLSENDYTAKEFIETAQQNEAWRGALAREQLTRVDLSGTDHTCSDRAGRLQLEEATAAWLAQHLPPGGVPPAHA